MRTRKFIPAAALTAVALTAAVGCGQPGAPAATSRQQAIGYMQAHPQPPVTGTTTGIILTADVAGFLGAAARQAGCPAQLTVAVTSAVGNLPACGAWTATAVTPSGTIMDVTCGSISARQACPLMLRPGGYVPVAGDYVRFWPYIPAGLPADVRLIFSGAVYVPGDDPGGPVWVTAPARSSA